MYKPSCNNRSILTQLSPWNIQKHDILMKILRITIKYLKSPSDINNISCGCEWQNFTILINNYTDVFATAKLQKMVSNRPHIPNPQLESFVSRKPKAYIICWPVAEIKTSHFMSVWSGFLNSCTISFLNSTQYSACSKSITWNRALKGNMHQQCMRCVRTPTKPTVVYLSPHKGSLDTCHCVRIRRCPISLPRRASTLSISSKFFIFVPRLAHHG